jgi:hypothetical protein
MIIRQATKKDYPAIAEVMNRCWPFERTSAEALELNTPEIRTSNESSNQAMLSINDTLGYVKQPVWIEFVKTFKEES